MTKVKFLPCWRLHCPLSAVESIIPHAHDRETPGAVHVVCLCPLHWPGQSDVAGASGRVRSCFMIAVGGFGLPLDNACSWNLLALYCEVCELSIIIEFVLVVNVYQLFEVDLVAQNGTDTTKTLDELVAFA